MWHLRNIAFNLHSIPLCVLQISNTLTPSTIFEIVTKSGWFMFFCLQFDWITVLCVILPEYEFTALGPCSATCGSGTMTREHICTIGGTEVLPEECGGFQRRLITLNCYEDCPGKKHIHLVYWYSLSHIYKLQLLPRFKAYEYQLLFSGTVPLL